MKKKTVGYQEENKKEWEEESWNKERRKTTRVKGRKKESKVNKSDQGCQKKMIGCKE
jgi:hypothetical protein